MWLGTYETAEEAAKAYDEVAYLLRGSNTRTNFITHVSMDSPLASQIQNLLNNRKGTKKLEDVDESAARVNNTTTSSASSTSTNSNNNGNNSDNSLSSGTIQKTQLFDDAYRPYLNKFEHFFDHFPVAHMLDLPKLDGLVDAKLSKFERMKVEKLTSSLLYAVNGVPWKLLRTLTIFSLIFHPLTLFSVHPLKGLNDPANLSS